MFNFANMIARKQIQAGRDFLTSVARKVSSEMTKKKLNKVKIRSAAQIALQTALNM